ncbi:hypothetical protein F4809DRAFT_636478 [Biscogniauxia mediterranea]|nr:hypothetical protein F4809DRAFT_636478 [Biscogniauxia mediterranea]
MYDNPGGLIAGSVIMEFVSALCVGLRLYLRKRKQQKMIVSDWLILVSFIFATGLTIVEIYGVKVESLGYSLGGTIEDPRAVTGRLNKAKHIELAFLLLGVANLGFIKLSVCFLYWHLFAEVMLRRFLIFWMVIIVVWATSFVLAGLLECGSHLTALFGQPSEYLEHCGSSIPSGWAMVGSDIATDFITLIIPIPVILRLNMSTQKKILTILTFIIGALSVGASIAKGYIYIDASLRLYQDDAILILTALSIWNLTEVQVGIIASCGPTLRPVITYLSPTKNLLSSFGSRWRSKLKLTEQSSGFDKMVESKERLGDRPTAFPTGSNVGVGLNDYELPLRPDATRPGDEV